MDPVGPRLSVLGFGVLLLLYGGTNLLDTDGVGLFPLVICGVGCLALGYGIVTEYWIE